MIEAIDPSGPPRHGAPLLEVSGVSKAFPGVVALNGVRFDLDGGEVHALMGENGAGKSTLIKILGGIYQADSGRVSLRGEPAEIRDVGDAQRLGISIVHQELSLVEDMTVAENLFLGKELRKRLGFVDRAAMEKAADGMLRRFEAGISAEAKVSGLSLGQKQIVEITKALLDNASIIIMDEPTASLTRTESERLYEVIAALKAHGCGIIYVSHRMDEVFRLSDRITVFRDGQYIATRKAQETNSDELIRLMVGRNLEFGHAAAAGGSYETRFAVKSVSTPSGVADVSFHVGKGEIVGFYGLIGAGRTELARAIFGVDARHSGEVSIDGKTVDIASPADAIAHGIGLVPESRKEQGLVMSETVRFNATLAALGQCVSGLFLSAGRESRLAQRYVDELQIKVSSLADSVAGLSGGNQQKIVLGKWLAAAPRVVILDEPTRGIDIGAKAQIYRVVRQLAEKGLPIIFISSDLPEVMHISDRLYVMKSGRIVAELEHGSYLEEQILSHASGVGDVQAQ